LTEEPHSFYMRLAKTDDLPVIFTGHRVQVALAQKADVICVRQFIDGARIAPEPPVVEPDGLTVLQTAVNQLIFLVPANGGSNARRSHGQSYQDERHHEDDGKQDEP